MEELRDLTNHFRQQQEKFVYYIIALSVTAIGFSVYKTTGQPIKWIQIPLGLAILMWSLSIYYGITFLKYVLSSLYVNKSLIEIEMGGENEYYSINKAKSKERVISELQIELDTNSIKAQSLFNRQGNLFYSGVVLFIIWHIIEMSTNI